MSDQHDTRAVMRVAFWSWMTIIIVGLAIMIVLPIVGR
jgi:hypothetical protein